MLATALDVHIVGDTAAYAAAAAALIGVVVGGLLNGFVTWLLDRNRRRADGRVAALQVAAEVLISMPALIELREAPTWGTLIRSHAFGKHTAWDANEALLCHALVPDGYISLAAAYRGLTNAASRAAEGPISAEIPNADGFAIASTYLAINRGLSYLNLLLHMPAWWKLRARSRFKRDQKAHVENLLDQDVNYQAFMAKYGRAQE